MSKVMLSCHNESMEVELARTHAGLRVAIGGRQLLADGAIDAEGRGWVRIDGRVTPFCVWRDGTRVQVWLNGAVHEFAAASAGARRDSRTSIRDSRTSMNVLVEALTAPMPGSVVKVLVAKGESFEAHQPLIIMESMKMEMTLSAPAAGRVLEVLCSAGQLVEMGALLARLEASKGDGE